MPATELLPSEHGNGPRLSPAIDGWVLPDSPAELSAKGADSDVPAITGYQANDGLLSLPPISTVEAFRMQMAKQFGGFETEFEKIYGLKGADDIKRVLIESARDRERVAMFLWASRREKNHHQPVFTYYFDRAIPWPQHPEFGAFHSGELPYFFGNLNKLDRPWEEVDRVLAKTTQAYLKNFATAGNPNGSGLEKWERVRADVPSTMEIGARIGPMPLADKNRLEFWTRFFDSPQGSHAPLF